MPERYYKATADQNIKNSRNSHDVKYRLLSSKTVKTFTKTFEYSYKENVTETFPIMYQHLKIQELF